MKEIRYLLFLISLIFFIGCKTSKYNIIHLSNPPEIYKPVQIYKERDLLYEYKRSLMKISEWQNWYNIQVSSNFF